MNNHLKGLGAKMANGGPKANIAPSKKMGEAKGVPDPSSLQFDKTFPRKNASERTKNPGSNY